MKKRHEKYLKNIPTIPDVVTKILSIAEDKLDISFQELNNIIKIDPGLSAKILKVANSALYARQREVNNLQVAITLLGFKTIKSLVLLITASKMFDKNNTSTFYEDFWRHSVMTAFIAKDLCLRCKMRSSAEGVFSATLLHDIGRIALFNEHKDKYQQLLEKEKEAQKSVSELENDAFGFNHREVGGDILAAWNFPNLYVDITREHGLLNITSSHKTSIVLASIADILATKLGFGYYIPQMDNQLKQLMLHITMLTEKDINYYLEEFQDILKEDPIFLECQSLFGV